MDNIYPSITEIDNTIKIKYFDLYKLITLVVLIFIAIFSYYFGYIKLFSPLLIFIAIYSVRIIKIKNICKNKDLPYFKLFHRTILLLCIYLYSEYTVKCIPILDLVFNKIFNFPITGKILKCFFSYLFLEFSDKIINNYNNSIIPNNNEEDICKIDDSNEKLSLTLIILGIIICNTYIDDVKNYFKKTF